MIQPKKFRPHVTHHVFINGLPGFVTVEEEACCKTTTLQIENRKIAAIYAVRNPDKLRHLGAFH